MRDLVHDLRALRTLTKLSLPCLRAFLAKQVGRRLFCGRLVIFLPDRTTAIVIATLELRPQLRT